MLLGRFLQLVLVFIVFDSVVWAGAVASNSTAKPLASVVGQLISAATIDGIAAPAGTTVFSRSLVASSGAPVTLHLRNGSVLELASRSTVYFHTVAPSGLSVSVKTGMVRYGRPGATGWSAAAPTTFSLSQRRTGQEIVGGSIDSGIVSVLMREARAGDTILFVNDTKSVAKGTPVLIKSRDNARFEVHYVKDVNDAKIILDTPLGGDFLANDVLIQGCQCDAALGIPQDGIVALLTQEVSADQTVVHVNTTEMLDPKARTMIRKKDGSFQEIHSIASIDPKASTITFKGKIQGFFEPGDVLVQGCTVPPVFGGFPLWWKAALFGAAAGTAGTTTAVTVWGDDDCQCEESPSIPRR